MADYYFSERFERLLTEVVMVATQFGGRKIEQFAVTRFVDHPSFHEKDAIALYRRAGNSEGTATSTSHLPDEVTRELAKAMHYAAYRFRDARNTNKARHWRQRYVELRNQIVVGNRKLIFRAVHSRVRDPQLAEDCAAECHIVMIRAVAAYNPWLGIRFSTYAFTCLLRELSRLLQKQTKDRLRQAVSFDDTLAEDAFEAEANDEGIQDSGASLGKFFAAGHTLLDDREKQVLSQRFGLNSDGSTVTLKDIGSELKISKERVRQLQNSGLDKLREVVTVDCVGV
jgi:RNA polymerase sigma factor (sigma-70 family)